MLQKKLSKVCVLAETSMKKKHHAIAQAALGGCGGLRQLWEALAELWEALGELWEGLCIEKLPINRTSGRYVNLRELVLTHVILATVHGEGRLRAAVHYVTSAGSGGSGGEFPKACFGATLPYFWPKWSYRAMCFLCC